MDDNEINKIVKLFYNQFLDKSYDFHGLTLKPVLYDGRQGYEVFWELENKNNLSCNETVVVDYIHELASDFTKLVSNRENNMYRDYWKRLCKLQTDIFSKYGTYINRADRKKLNTILYNISEINFKKFHCDIEFTDFYIDAGGGEDIYFGYNCVMTNLSYAGNEVEDFSDEYSGIFCNLFYDDDFIDYQDDLMRPFIREIINNPLLFDNTYMYYTNDFIAKDLDGKTLYC